MYFSFMFAFYTFRKILENQYACKYIVAYGSEYPSTRSRKSHSFAMLARLWSVIDTTNIHGSAFMK